MKHDLHSTRRQFFSTCGVGVGKIALASLLASELSAAEPVKSNNAPHFPAKTKRVIYLFMAGAPSQLDLFDHKPKLTELEGKPLPPSVIAGQRYAFIQPDAAVLGPRFNFKRHGESGVELASVLPHLASVADDCSFIKTVHTDQFNHAPAQLLVNTGNGVPGRPSMGSWLTYGLGSETKNLPGFVVLKSGGNLSGGASMWSSGFLPGVHQGVPFRGQGDPILHVRNPQGFDRRAQRDSLDLVGKLNQKRFEQIGDPEIQTRIAAYEMAFRMQKEAPELMDFSNETKETLDLYGAAPGKESFANSCLLARRLAQRGVRFIQLYHSGWDHHSQVEKGLTGQCKKTDQATAALLTDLKRLGMLEDTLVVWGGEFGRTPMVEASKALGRSLGRDHHPQAYTIWMAGGGVQSGVTVGKTDELGFHPVERPVHVHDVQATILHLMGIDHKRLTYKFRGLNFKLTGLEERHAVQEIIG